GGALAAAEHGAAGPAEPESAAADRGRAPHDVRPAAEPVAAGRGRGEGVLREPGVPYDDPAQRAARGGAELREADRRLRRDLGRCAKLSLARARGDRPE